MRRDSEGRTVLNHQKPKSEKSVSMKRLPLEEWGVVVLVDWRIKSDNLGCHVSGFFSYGVPVARRD